MKSHRTTLVFLFFVALAIVGCASGSAILTGTARTPIKPEQVKLYLDAPASFEVIGLVNASSSSGSTEQGSMDYAVEELKRQAAKLGANGVLLISSADMTETAIGGYGSGYMYAVPYTRKSVQGKAIFVIESIE